MEAASTQAEYMAAVAQVVDFVQSSLDEVVTPRQLANVAGFSPHHFHRIFRAYAGESVMDFVRRLRLERAAYRLRNTEEGILEIAIDAGYGSGEAFTRVFQAYFGVAPSVFRTEIRAYRLPAPSGVHYAPGGFSALHRAVEPEMLEERCLCEFHRLSGLNDVWEQALDLLTSFSELVYPGINKGEPRMTEATTESDREIEAL